MWVCGDITSMFTIVAYTSYMNVYVKNNIDMLWSLTLVYLSTSTHYIMSIELASITKSSFMMVRWSCIHWNFGRRLFVLACTPPPGLATSRVCLRSLLVYWLSRLAVGSGSVWTHMRTAPGTPGSGSPLLPHRSATTSSQWWGYLAHLLLGTWCWRWHTTDQWAAPG